MRILVTGGSGFIGTNLVGHLLENGVKDILNIDIQPPQEPLHAKYYQKCSIMEKEKLAGLIKAFMPTHVVHLAATCGLDRQSLDDYAANIDGNRILIDILRQISSVERVVFTSSLLVCKMGYIPKHDTDYMPTTLYGKSKVEGEKVVRGAKNLSFIWTIIRPISIWGPWGREPYINFFKSIAGGWYFHAGNGHYKRSLGYVENSVFQIFKILEAPQEKVSGKTFYVADDKPADLYDMAMMIKESVSARRILHIPKIIVYSIAMIGDILKKLGWKNVPLTSFRLKNILTEYVFDMSPIMEISGPLPYTIKDGVERTIAWLKEQGELKA